MTVVVKCRVFGASQGRGVMLMSGFGLLAVFGAIALGLSAAVAVTLLFAGILAAMSFLVGTATYTLSNGAITRHYRSLSGHNEQRDTRVLRDLAAWKLDREMSRGFEHYEYLELDALDGQRWIITSRQDAAGFARFKDAVLAELSTLPPSASANAAPIPRQRESFYHSWLGRSLALLFALVCGVLVVVGLFGILPATGLIKLLVFTVPGTLYFLWRSFGPNN